MNEIYVLINTTNGETSHWTLPEILHEINRDRSEEWTDYDCSDWREGLEEWTEYRLIDLKRIGKPRIFRSGNCQHT